MYKSPVPGPHPKTPVPPSSQPKGLFVHCRPSPCISPLSPVPTPKTPVPPSSQPKGLFVEVYAVDLGRKWSGNHYEHQCFVGFLHRSRSYDSCHQLRWVLDVKLVTPSAARLNFNIPFDSSANGDWRRSRDFSGSRLVLKDCFPVFVHAISEQYCYFVSSWMMVVSPWIADSSVSRYF